MSNRFIGAVAREVGVSPRTLRYYEALGLLPRSARTDSGYRVYDSRTRIRIGFIRKAKTLGLTLREIRAILEIYDRGRAPCRSFRRRLQAHLRRVESQIRHLRLLRARLRHLLGGWPENCETNGNVVCPRMQAFACAPRTSTRVLMV